MEEHRCPKCNKLLFKFDYIPYTVISTNGGVEIETQHRCKAKGNEKELNIKTIE